MNYINDLSNINANKTICRPWKRKIKVILSSEKIKKSMSFGDNEGNNFNIKIRGRKELSLLQDCGVIEISNISYSTILEIMKNEYYHIEVMAGYENGNFETYFKGYVSYISQRIQSRRDYTLYIAYASELVAKFSLARVNFNFNSSINMYSVLNYIAKSQGINMNLSSNLKNEILLNAIGSDNIVGAIKTILNENTSNSWLASSDSSLSQIVNVSDLKDKKVIIVDPNSIIINGGNPTVSSDGLHIKLLPTYNVCPGNILCIDNSLIDISSDSEKAYENFKPNFLDATGRYMVREVEYVFENRGQSFQLDIKGRALSLYQNLAGGEDND